MEESRPLYCCITEGSGGSGSPRMTSTTALLQALGATAGPVYGRYSDKAIYRFLLEGAREGFVGLTIELAEFLVDSGVTEVAGDAVEGFNPAHDVCRFVVDGAVNLVRARTGRILGNYDFVLDDDPDVCPDSLRSDVRRIDLDAATLERKIGAALAYSELRGEVTLALERFGHDAFAVECLRPSTTRLMIEQFDRDVPAYEHYGQMRVSQGRYQEIIRYRQHVLPVRDAIERATRP